MRSIRIHKGIPRTHEDLVIVDWNNEYDFVMRHFGGLPHTNNGISEKTMNRCCRPFRRVEDIQNTTINPDQWWKIQCDDYEVIKSIPFGTIVAFSSTRILKDTIMMLYDIYKNNGRK